MSCDFVCYCIIISVISFVFCGSGWFGRFFGVLVVVVTDFLELRFCVLFGLCVFGGLFGVLGFGFVDEFAFVLQFSGILFKFWWCWFSGFVF